MAHMKAIIVLAETYSLHMNKSDNVEDKLLLVCLKLFTNSFRTLFNINNPISRHSKITVHEQLLQGEQKVAKSLVQSQARNQVYFSQAGVINNIDICWGTSPCRAAPSTAICVTVS